MILSNLLVVGLSGELNLAVLVPVGVQGHVVLGLHVVPHIVRLKLQL